MKQRGGTGEGRYRLKSPRGAGPGAPALVRRDKPALLCCCLPGGSAVQRQHSVAEAGDED